MSIVYILHPPNHGKEWLQSDAHHRNTLDNQYIFYEVAYTNSPDMTRDANPAIVDVITNAKKLYAKGVMYIIAK